MKKSKFWSYPGFFISAFAACGVIALTSGCASGGFKLTRSYARWVNSNNILVRIILYILTAIVFVVTLLVDYVINNTIDFWNGTVSQGTYHFDKDGKSFVAKHEILPGSLLKRSTIRVTDSSSGKLLQVVVLKETASHEVELYVDGHLRTRVQGLSKIPVATIFDKDGHKIEDRIIHLDTAVAEM